MVEAMKLLTRNSMLILALSVPALCPAQELDDPTRPPARLAAADAAGGAIADGVPVLQSVLVGRGAGARRVAVIDGDTVREGDSWRGSRVARIRPGEVVLTKGKDRQVLRMAAEGDGELSIARIIK